MRASRISLIIVGLIAVISYFTLFTVLEVKNAIVLQFGDPKRVITEPGLNFKIPFIQNVIFIDNRILDIDAPAAEIIASDQKRLIVDAFVKFKIVDVLEFYKALGNENVARSRISAVVNSRIRGVLGEEPLSAVLSESRSKLMKQITSLVEAEVKDFGIEIVDLRLKRTELTPEVQSNVFDRMRTEREREANLLRAEGQEISQKIKATADRQKIEIIAEAEKQSNILKGEGEAARNKILNDAFARDPEFFEFIRSMEAYSDTFKDGTTTMVISPDSDFFEYFENSEGSN